MFKAWAASRSETPNSARNTPQVLTPAENNSPSPSISSSTNGAKSKRPSPAQLRINADLAELSDQEMVRINLTSDPQELSLVIKPTTGPYRNGAVEFSVKFSDDYPHKPPRVRCVQSIYHPNIEPAGGVCLDILREAWTPIRSLTDIIIGLRHIMLHPNATDPLNVEAAEDMIEDYDRFVSNVRKTMKGVELKSVTYSNILN